MVMLWRFANGLDDSRVMPCEYDPPIKRIGYGVTTTEDLMNEMEVYHIFLELSQQVGWKLRQEHLATTKVQICVRDNTLDYREYQGKLPYAESYRTLQGRPCNLPDAL